MIIEAEETKKVAHEALIDVAKHCVQAIYHAPQITGRLEVKTAIVTGEELQPAIDLLKVLGEDEMVLWMDAETYQMAMDEGNPPVVLFIGADLTKSQHVLNCGACGFGTCAEFNKYSAENYGVGSGAFGPSCMMNVLDFGIACDWACAAAHQYNVENRIHVSVGITGLLLGYLENVSYVLGLSLGPLKEFWYYNRPAFTRMWSREFHDQFWVSLTRTLFPVMFQTFSGEFNPFIKTYDKWWEKEKQDYVKVVEDPEINEKKSGLMAKTLEAVAEKRAQLEAIKAKRKAENAK